jgi:thiosulfate/3-mercaptopyruvate sulfurtransferase
MKRMLPRTILLAFFLALIVPCLSAARGIEPIVSTDWLAKSLNDPKVVIVDIRKVEDYRAGHIPGSVNIFYNTWAITEGALRNQVPPLDDLTDIIVAAGITPDSRVVVVGNADNPSNRAGITRIAWTLKYAGLSNIAVLDGGYEKWLAQKKPVSTEPVRPKPSTFKPKADETVTATKGYVLGAIGKELIVDTRNPGFYEGKEKLDFVARAGRIKGAVNLPATAAYNADGTFKSKKELADLAVKVVGSDPGRKIIVYCDTGKMATIWAYLLTEVLGYKNVRMYDGSSEEWAKDPKAPVEP